MLRKLITTLLLIAVFFSYGCTQIQYASEKDADYQQIIEFTPVNDKGVVYIIRDKESDFQIHELSVNFNNQKVNLWPMTYTRVVVKPGQYNLEPNIPGVFSIEEELNINIKPGDVVFLKMEAHARIGIPNKGSITVIPEDVAKRGIQIYKLKPAPTKHL